jgi:uncharacterized protein (UPF0332 family)
MTGDDFLRVAGELFAPLLAGKRPVDEALCRTVIGRAYYGAFHLAKAYLDQLGVKTGTHGKPASFLAVSGEAHSLLAGRHLSELYEARRRADYSLSQARVTAECCNLHFVKDQIEKAIEVKALLDKCLVEPVRSQVKAGIEANQARVRR